MSSIFILCSSWVKWACFLRRSPIRAFAWSNLGSLPTTRWRISSTQDLSNPSSTATSHSLRNSFSLSGLTLPALSLRRNNNISANVFNIKAWKRSLNFSQAFQRWGYADIACIIKEICESSRPAKCLHSSNLVRMSVKAVKSLRSRWHMKNTMEKRQEKSNNLE